MSSSGTDCIALPGRPLLTRSGALSVFTSGLVLLGCSPGMDPGAGPDGGSRNDAGSSDDRDAGSPDRETDSTGRDTVPEPDAGSDIGPPEIYKTQTIGPGGGTVSFEGATLVVPPGALAANVEVRVTVAAATRAGYNLYSSVFRFEPAGTSFARPVSLSLPFSGDANLATVFWSRRSGTGFDRLGGVPSGNTVTAPISHFSEGFVADGVAYTEQGDRSCTRVGLFEGRSGVGNIPLAAGGTADLSSAIALLFSVQDCQGRPIRGLGPDDFALKENGSPLSVEANRTALSADGLQIFASLVLDLSSSTLPHLPEVIAGAKSFVAQLHALDARPHVSIEVFAGDAELTRWQAPTLDSGVLNERLDAAGTFSPGDPSSTNLYGAVLDAVERIKADQAAFRERNRGGAFTAGFVVLFTDGQDTTGLKTRAAAIAAAKGPGTEVMAVALESADFDSAAHTTLKEMTEDRVLVTPQAALLDREFAALAHRIAALQSAAYVLGYCTPKRANSHTVSIEVVGSTTQQAGEYTFDATDFRPGCSSTQFHDVCLGKDCGGVGCGYCDDRTTGCDASFVCVNSCQPAVKCGGAVFTNPQGYQQTCDDMPVSTTCGATCVDVTGDEANCGTCGTVCPASFVCARGSCACPTGQDVCGGTCVDLRTDPASCGACGVSCGESGSCAGGHCSELFAAPASYVYQVERSGPHLYWADSSGLKRKPVAGGPVETVGTIGGGWHASTGLKLVGATGYFMMVPSSATSVVLFRASLAGGMAEEVIRFGSFTAAFTIDATHVYWVFSDSTGQPGWVHRSPLAGGAAQVLASGLAPGGHLEVRDGYVYWDSDGYLMRVPVTGGAAAQFFKLPSGSSRALPSNAEHLYFSSDRLLARRAWSGGAVETVFPSNSPTHHSSGSPLGVDATHLYFTGLEGPVPPPPAPRPGPWVPPPPPPKQLLVKAPLSGTGIGTTLAFAPFIYARGIAVDATHVYYVRGDGFAIMRTLK
jgi:hypothetical protein